MILSSLLPQPSALYPYSLCRRRRRSFLEIPRFSNIVKYQYILNKYKYVKLPDICDCFCCQFSSPRRSQSDVQCNYSLYSFIFHTIGRCSAAQSGPRPTHRVRRLMAWYHLFCAITRSLSLSLPLCSVRSWPSSGVPCPLPETMLLEYGPCGGVVVVRRTLILHMYQEDDEGARGAWGAKGGMRGSTMFHVVIRPPADTVP